jgi:hypothetical protein
MVAHPRIGIKSGGNARTALSPRQPEDYQQGSIEVFGCFHINIADDAPNPVTAQGDHLVRHDLRAKAKAV